MIYTYTYGGFAGNGLDIMHAVFMQASQSIFAASFISELATAILLYTVKTQALTVAIYTQIVRGNYGIASAMATVLTVMTLLSLLIFNKISKDGDLTM